MNQYQRMVSYLYEYKQGVKGVNVGYVRIEQRGGKCRISLQMRSRNLGQLPDVAVFRQGKEGIQFLTLCPLTERNGDYRCRIETEAEDLLGSGIALSEVDGIILYQEDTYYVATTWKNTGVYLGEKRKWNRDEMMEPAESHSADTEGVPVQREVSEKTLENPQKVTEQSEEKQEISGEMVGDSREIVESSLEEPIEQKEDSALHTTEQRQKESEQSRTFDTNRETVKQLETQTVCGNCPFKRKEADYGKRILMTFPSMRPFPNDAGRACVRIEPQDLGCLPMQLWHLANNQFLLQGYYCYRHLIFLETEKHCYALGVPGIYSERDRCQAEQFGFSQFRPLCNGRHCMGAFGYWLMPLAL